MWLSIRSLCLISAALAMWAQTVTTPSFEVASVRLANAIMTSPATTTGGPGTADPGRVTLTQMPMKSLIARAYGLDLDEIDGPAWLSDLRERGYTITATMPADTTREQFRLMLQNLLAERFHLKVHREVRSFRGYELIVASGGPKLSKWTPEPEPAGPRPRFSADSQGFPVLPRGLTGCSWGFSPGVAQALRVSCRQSMADFMKYLARFINFADAAPNDAPKPRVTDKTELPDTYEFHLKFEGTVATSLPPRPVGADNAPESGPDLPVALEKQLGLKLVKSKNVPVNMLVVDYADQMPTEN